MKSLISVLTITLLLLPGCARRISQNYYSAASVGEAAHTYKGTIISARRVEVGEAERLQDNTTGLAVGGIAGGVAGSQIGSGSGSVLAAAGGAILGGLAGAYAQDELSRQAAVEYSVQLTNGQIMTVVQGAEEVYQAGQPVLVIVSKKGRSRIVPDQSMAQRYQQPVQSAGVPVSTVQKAAPVTQVSSATSTKKKKTFYVPQEGVKYVNVNVDEA
ncbi:MAG: hypothetical protein CMM87_06560 [Rickettsiales bacterium]|nr:hypothetical protein [Rickettsiales bacterium]|tara:strand:- start:5959 stop:6603 length:645 start_codon:yes stop_codon:yes gene_type:complete